MIPCTAPDVRAIIPTNTEIQQKQSAKAIESAERREHSEPAGADLEAHEETDTHRHDEEDQVADDVGHDGADQRGGPRDRQRPEPVEDALLDVLVEVHDRC